MYLGIPLFRNRANATNVTHIVVGKGLLALDGSGNIMST